MTEWGAQLLAESPREATHLGGGQGQCALGTGGYWAELRRPGQGRSPAARKEGRCEGLGCRHQAAWGGDPNAGGTCHSMDPPPCWQPEDNAFSYEEEGEK